MSPSTMNGMRMNQLVAPTSFMTSISRRRANMAVRIVFQIRMHATRARAPGDRDEHPPQEVRHGVDPLHRLLGVHDVLHARPSSGTACRCRRSRSESSVRGTTR